MVGGTFLLWRHICLVQYELWSRIKQICRLHVFVSNVPPINNEFESNVPPQNVVDQLQVLYYWSWFMKTQFILGLRNLVAKSDLSRLRAFGRHIYARMWWLEAQKHLRGPGAPRRPWIWFPLRWSSWLQSQCAGKVYVLLLIIIITYRRANECCSLFVTL